MRSQRSRCARIRESIRSVLIRASAMAAGPEKKRPCLLVPNRLASGESDVSARQTARRGTYMSSGRLLNFPARSSSSGSPRLCRHFGSPAVESGDALALHCGE
jgi:hypothetical protein